MKDRNYTFAGATQRLSADHETIVADAGEAAASFAAFRKEWRAAYKDIAAEIRATRVRMKTAPSLDDRGLAQSRRHYGRLAAANMMTLLEAAKAARRRVVLGEAG
jgi:hypothetical protein